MEELDLLKKDWKRNENSFTQVSENEIYKMIHRNSSSVVKWIMIIGILEFLFLTGLGFYFADDSYTKSLEKFHIDTLMTILTFVNYAVCIGFIFHFYKNFKNISTTDSSRMLMKNILKARKTVKYYVAYNLSMACIIFIIILISSCIYDETTINTISKINSQENAFLTWAGFIGGILFVLALLLGLFWLFYKLIYGFLLRKLYRNYQELKKIDL